MLSLASHGLIWPRSLGGHVLHSRHSQTGAQLLPKRQKRGYDAACDLRSWVHLVDLWRLRKLARIDAHFMPQAFCSAENRASRAMAVDWGPPGQTSWVTMEDGCDVLLRTWAPDGCSGSNVAMRCGITCSSILGWMFTRGTGS